MLFNLVHTEFLRMIMYNCTCCDHSGTHGDRGTQNRVHVKRLLNGKCGERSGASELAKQLDALFLRLDSEGFQNREAVLLSLQPPNCCDHNGTHNDRERSHTKA